MSHGVIAVNMMICENILTEADGVMSAIRMVDVFNVDLSPEVPLESQGMKMKLLTVGKVEAGDQSKRQAVFQVIKPDGSTKDVASLTIEPPKTSRYPGAPKGFAVVLEIGVSMKQLGLHYVVLFLDGKEQCRTPFTLVERPKQQESSTESPQAK